MEGLQTLIEKIFTFQLEEKSGRAYCFKTKRKK